LAIAFEFKIFCFSSKKFNTRPKTHKFQEDIMAEEKEIKEVKAKKLADPVAATIDSASQQMIERAHELGIETAFDRAVTLKPCNIGTQGICCKNCGMWDLEVDPIKHAHKMIAHIDQKRQALGIDRARERILVDMAARRDYRAA
jgi:hypothetical protein